MAILSDNQIVWRVREDDMISPFVPAQVKQDKNGNGIVSYGLSSYGYDIRVGTSFRIFTNVHNSVVDPKHFDEKSFLRKDVAPSEGIIIPPNSFCLCHSYETLRIPRDILVICMGKSTYARCFEGSQRFWSGYSLVSLEEAVNSSKRIYGYGIEPETSQAMMTELYPHYTGKSELLEIVFSDGSSIKCTPDHKFLAWDGDMIEAQELSVGDSLYHVHKKEVRGYDNLFVGGNPIPCHRLADEWNIRHGIYSESQGDHRHHKDGDKKNNNPTNIQRLDGKNHISYHSSKMFSDPEWKDYILGKAAQARSESNAFKKAQQNRAMKFWYSDEYKEKRAQHLENRKSYWSNKENCANHQEKLKKAWQDPELREKARTNSLESWRKASKDRREQQAEIMRRVRTRQDITEDLVWQALLVSGTLRGAARELKCDRSVIKRRFPQILEKFKNTKLTGNHKIVSINPLKGERETFCAVAPETGNFMLENGLVADNCGLIVNITPLEPEWCGEITLEISNTTPLPAKVYAGEGIAQLIFHKGDMVCRTSYADKDGKYQNQSGVTLGKV